MFAKILKYAVLFIVLVLISCAKDDISGNNSGDDTGEAGLSFDTITYRALVYANEEVVNARYGGEDEFKKGLKQLFKDVTLFWNSSKNKFDYYFCFEAAGLKLYKTADFDNTMENEINKSLDVKYDFTMVFNLDSDHNGAACGGGSGFSVVTMHKTLEDQDVYGDIFHNGNVKTREWGVYNTLGHEFGHYRGATDIYQYGISAANNPVNGAVFEEPKCIMNNSGAWEWSDYASAVFNYTAKWLRLPSGYMSERFPKNMEILITENEVPLKGAEVNFYGCRGNGTKKDRTDGVTSPDVYSVPFRTLKTDDNGKILITDVEHLYQVQRKNEPTLPESLPYEYWFNFLVIAKHPVSGKTSYIWLPDLEMQRDHLENGTETYKVLFEFK